MKEYLCVLLSACLVVSTSCSTQTKNNHRPTPTPAADPKQVEETEKQVEGQANAQAGVIGKDNQSFNLAKAAFDAAVNTYLKNGSMRIKDYDGQDLSVSEYRTNPTQGFILMAEDDGYSVLKTSVDVDVTNIKDLDKVAFNYEVFEVDGKMDAFKGKKLDGKEPTISEKLTVDTKNVFANGAAIKDLFDRLKSEKYASHHGTLEQISSFLFPTAYAGHDKDKKKKLLITAIVFTSVAVLAYIFSYYPIGDISTAVALTFWLLYAFE